MTELFDGINKVLLEAIDMCLFGSGGNVERFRARAQRTIRIVTEDAYTVAGANPFAAALDSPPVKNLQARSSREDSSSSGRGSLMIVLERIDVSEDKTKLNHSIVPVRVFPVVPAAAHDDLLASYLKNCRCRIRGKQVARLEFVGSTRLPRCN